MEDQHIGMFVVFSALAVFDGAFVLVDASYANIIFCKSF